MNNSSSILYNPRKCTPPTNWKLIRVGAFAKLVAGGTPSTRINDYWEDGSILWMRSGDVHKKRIFNVDGRITQKGLDNSSAALLPKNSVLVALAGQGKTRGTVAINKVELSTNQSVAAILPKKDLDYEYLYYNLDARYEVLRRLSTGDGGRGGLNLKILKNIWCMVPPLPEQRKIAEILSTWDEAIARTEQLIAALQERKKGLMQRLLTGEVRFPGFDGEWKEVRLRDVFKRIRRKVGEKKVDYFLSITATVGFVDQREKFGKIIAGANRKNYVLLKRGEFSYNKGNSIPYPQGCIYFLEDFEEGALPNVYFSFAANSPNVHALFYKHYFESGMLNRQLKKYISSSARSDGLFNISFDDFFSIYISLPPKDEQEKIAAVLQASDAEIELHQQKLAALQQQKKGLMQRLLTGQVRVN